MFCINNLCSKQNFNLSLFLLLWPLRLLCGSAFSLFRALMGFSALEGFRSDWPVAVEAAAEVAGEMEEVAEVKVGGEEDDQQQEQL